MTIDSTDDSKISNRTITTNRISNRTYDSKSNRITKLRRSLVFTSKMTYIVSGGALNSTHSPPIQSVSAEKFQSTFPPCPVPQSVQPPLVIFSGWSLCGGRIIFCPFDVIFFDTFRKTRKDEIHLAGSETHFAPVVTK